MVKCKTLTCEADVKEGYPYCPDCYNAWKRSQTPIEAAKKTGQWHTDPVIDQMMKSNGNSGKIVQLLERIAICMENNHESLQAVFNGKKKE